MHSTEVQFQQPTRVTGRRSFSTRMKASLAVFVLVLVGGAVYWQFSSSPTPSVQPQYPQTVAGVFYSSPITGPDGTNVTFPYAFADRNKLVFLDLKLEKTTSELTYQGRTIPLNLYKSGEYLPLITIITPAKKVISGIRVCEPCGSFSFHIVQGKYLDCDSCHTKWNIETLNGVEGGCQSYPPPQLSSLVGNDNIGIDLMPLGTILS